MDINRVPFWKSFTTLLFVAYGITTVLLIALFTILVFENQVDLIAENALYAALRTGDRIRNVADAHASDSGLDDFGRLASRLENLGTDEGDIAIVALRILDDRGTALYAANDVTPDLEEVRDIQTAITKRDFESRLFHHRVDIQKREITLFIPFASGEDQAVVIATLSVPRIDERLQYLNRQALILLGAVLVLHGGFIGYVYHLLIRPFKALTLSVERIAKGDFDAPVPPFRAVEFSRLSGEIQRMSYAVRDMQDSARSANPLTALPGNVEIEKHIRSLIEKKAGFCVLYADLDNFKAYNDAYGFSKGDEIILYTRDKLNEAVKENDLSDAFVGHQGGDDFVLTCSYEDWESLAGDCTRLFDADIAGFFSEDDREKGYIESVDRRGQSGRFDLVSLSIAVVSNHHRKISSIGEVAKIAAEMKKLVKSRKGSAYAIDRRVD